MTTDTMSPWADGIFKSKYAMTLENGGLESWDEAAARVAHAVCDDYYSPDQVAAIEWAIRERKFIPGGRYLYAAGRPLHQVNNCMLMTVDDSREGWAGLAQRATSALMTGAGIGVVYSALRAEGAYIRGLGGHSTGPISVMKMINEIGRNVMQGGSRRSAMWAGLHWDHPDVFKFIHAKDWSQTVKDAKAADFNFPADLDMTNISVILDDEFFAALADEGHPTMGHPDHEWAVRVYNEVTEQMVTTGEPGFSVDVGENAGEHLRNACTEVTSADDNDVCNLGSVNFSRIESKEELDYVTRLATDFLLAGTLYSCLPYDEVYETREKNRRLGLGLMGLHEWLTRRGKKYGPDSELGEWLGVWESASDDEAVSMALTLNISVPVKVRAIAPTGTIAILGETTGGIEPVFAGALKRRYLKGTTWHAQYIIDAAAKRMLDDGVDHEHIEDAYSIDVDRRLHFQSWVQTFVDHGISSTINMPAWGSDGNNEKTLATFRDTLIRYLPYVRGVTVYPDGGRQGQPQTPVTLAEALEHEGVEFEEVGNESSCRNGVCGI